MGVYEDIIEMKNEIRNQTGEDPRYAYIGKSVMLKVAEELRLGEVTPEDFKNYTGMEVVDLGQETGLIFLTREKIDDIE